MSRNAKISKNCVNKRLLVAILPCLCGGNGIHISIVDKAGQVLVASVCREKSILHPSSGQMHDVMHCK